MSPITSTLDSVSLAGSSVLLLGLFDPVLEQILLEEFSVFFYICFMGDCTHLYLLILFQASAAHLRPAVCSADIKLEPRRTGFSTKLCSGLTDSAIALLLLLL